MWGAWPHLDDAEKLTEQFPDKGSPPNGMGVTRASHYDNTHYQNRTQTLRKARALNANTLHTQTNPTHTT